MKFDFSSTPLRDAGFSEQPMTILNEADPKAMLCSIFEFALLETGSPSARKRWQQTQFRNLLKHVCQRSAFWKRRVGGKRPSEIKLATLPILTRQDVREQFTTEGSLLHATDGIPTKRHATSGSSGTPVHFWVSSFNGQYNSVRSIAQFFLEGLDISFNRTRIKPAAGPIKNGFSFEESPSYMGPLAPLIKSGTNKNIEYLNPDFKKLRKELERNEIGYLICAPRFLEAMFSLVDPIFLKKAKTKMWMSLAQAVTEDMKKTFDDLEIPIRASYSSEEVGPIGYECAACPGHYHVATSNVIVEIVDASYDIDGVKHGRVLVTHLHSYATPFIRYDLGDLACLADTCPCGHQGPTIHHLHGKVGSIVKHRDGRISPFRIRGRELTSLVSFTEYRIRQTGFEKLVVELGGRSELSGDEIAGITKYLTSRVGEEFEIEIKVSQEIDWGENRKRDGFRCEVA
jgi:phenylacetate-coenzyme A ligase PaaK-like adenylate-forming protein